jgi:hypothetical protein
LLKQNAVKEHIQEKEESVIDKIITNKLWYYIIFPYKKLYKRNPAMFVLSTVFLLSAYILFYFLFGLISLLFLWPSTFCYLYPIYSLLKENNKINGILFSKHELIISIENIISIIQSLSMFSKNCSIYLTHTENNLYSFLHFYLKKDNKVKSYHEMIFTDEDLYFKFKPILEDTKKDYKLSDECKINNAHSVIIKFKTLEDKLEFNKLLTLELLKS